MAVLRKRMQGGHCPGNQGKGREKAGKVKKGLNSQGI